MIWRMKYKETKDGPWIETTIVQPDSEGCWAIWSRPTRIPREYHTAVCYQERRTT